MVRASKTASGSGRITPPLEVGPPFAAKVLSVDTTTCFHGETKGSRSAAVTGGPWGASLRSWVSYCIG
jgi:hypothetical protein